MSKFLTALSVTPLADGQEWRLNEDLDYQSDLLEHDEFHCIQVPRGFITDFASVPRMLRSELPAWNTYGPAAVIHDYLYWTQTCDRDVADSVLREACRVLGVLEPTIMAIYLGVRIGGQSAWNGNAALKKSGYRRMASLQDLPPYASVT